VRVARGRWEDAVELVGIHQGMGYPGSLQLRRGFDGDRGLAGTYRTGNEDRRYESDHPLSASLALYASNRVEKMDSRKFRCGIVHSIRPEGQQVVECSSPASKPQPYMLWWGINMRHPE
jgi:hypothetical protein